MEQTQKANSFAVIGSFLVFELLAFAGFSLANSPLLYGLVGLVILILLFLGTKIDFKTKGFTNLILFVIPLVIYGLMLLISGFSTLFSTMDNFFVPVVLLSFAGIGALVREQQEFKLSTALLAIYGSLATLVFISYFWNMIQYQPFYTLTHSNYYTYYDGKRSPVPIGDIAYFLMGFSLEQVSVEYFSFFAILLSSALVALFFINPKKDKKSFILYAIFGGIGVLALITMPTKITLIFAFVSAIIMAIIVLGVKYFNKIFKWVSYAFFLMLGVAIIAFIVMVVYNQQFIPGLKSFRVFIKGSPILYRLFVSNRFAQSYGVILNDYFANIDAVFNGSGAPVKIFGFAVVGEEFSSSSILFDNLMMSGLIGTILFVVAIVFGYISFIKFFKNKSVPLFNKVMIASFINVYLFNALFNYDMQPYVHYSNYIPFYISGPFMLLLFLFGYTFKINSKTTIVSDTATDQVAKEVEFKEDAISL